MGGKGLAIIVAAFFTIALAYSIRYGYGMLLPGMIETLGISKTEAGLISSAYFCAYTAFSPLLGALSDRVSGRLLLTVFSALLATATLCMAYVDTAGQAAMVFALAGVGHAACWAPVVALVQRWVSDRWRGTALSVATMGSSVGIVAWSLWLPVVLDQSSYREGWMQMGLFGFVVTALNMVLVRNPPLRQEEAMMPSPLKDAPPIPRALLLYSKNLWLVGLSYACIGFAVLVPLTFLGVYATEELHFPVGASTTFFTVIAGAALVGKLSLGILSDRVSRLAVMMVCGLCIAMGCLGVVQFSSLCGKYVAVAVIGIGFGAVWPVYAAAAVDFFPKKLAGRVIGLWTLFMGVGSLISPIFCGAIIDASGDFTQAFQLGCAVALVSILFLLPLRANPGIVNNQMEGRGA
jgi:sugar phosphate permease